MRSVEAVDALIAQIDDAALYPSGWLGVLGRATEVLEAPPAKLATLKLSALEDSRPYKRSNCVF